MKTKYYFIIGLIFILLACNTKKEEPVNLLHMVADGYVRDSISNNPIKNYEIILYKNMKYEPDGNKDLFKCPSDSNGYYKFDVYLLPEQNDFNYSLGSSYNSIYYGGSIQPAGYYDVVAGQNKTINFYLIKR